MSTFQVVTSCSAKGWQDYGQRMHKSIALHWPTAVSFRLFSEDDIGHAREPMPEWLDEFKRRHAKNEVVHGMVRRGRYYKHYNYRFDAVRFAHKVAVVIEAARTCDADFLIWLDADTVTHSPVTLAFLESLAPAKDEVIAWLNRDHSYPECGFYILNMRNLSTLALLQQWKELYTGGKVFHLPEWHDSYVLMTLVKALNCRWKSLSGEAAGTGHPFINGPLGAVMDHLKGPRKAEGRSRKHDLKVQRTEDYWRIK